jgi:hypothetical protein
MIEVKKDINIEIIKVKCGKGAAVGTVYFSHCRRRSA